MNNRITLILLLLTLSWQSMAEHRVISASVAGRNLIIECVEQIYNFNFGRAQTLCRQIEGQYAGHPAVGLLSATNKYWQWYPERKDKLLESQIRTELKDASEKSSKWISSSAADIPEAMFIYFSAEALLARMDNFAHATMASVGHAKNAYPYIKKSFVHQDTYPDFLLVAGLYNYYRQEYVIIKPFYKAMVWFMQDGDKQLGLAQMKAACQSSLFSKAEAGIYLAHVLTDYEKKPQQAYQGLFELAERYPNNLYIQSKLCELYLHLRMPAKALPLIEMLRESKIAGYQVYAMISKARYDLLTGDSGSALAGASRLQAMDLKDETVLAYTHQIMAILDARQGRAELAKQHYRKVKQLSEYPILTDEADQYLQSH
ncbi:hypothetical protein [Dyadobacter sp. 50-39]|uniref:hypothetical protein n=1 Tax=Dyadobacter sp. 50-39 TaxID=1895756 RepID=UPI000A784255|nr:hypothetical protein [Dyadobacter sp. 50-39]